MNAKEIDARLVKANEKYKLVFGLNQPIEVDLYSDEVGQIKHLFIELMKALIENNITLKYIEDISIMNDKNQLIRDVASEYIDQLNHDLKLLLENDNLREIRNIKCE